MKDISNRKDIETLIDVFYTKVVEDETIGSFFTEVVQLDWDIHIPIMYDFWESILLGASKYKGNPMVKHIDLNRKKELKEEHLNRWVALWEETVHEHFSGKKADMDVQRAQDIAGLMKYKVDTEKQ